MIDKRFTFLAAALIALPCSGAPAALGFVKPEAIFRAGQHLEEIISFVDAYKGPRDITVLDFYAGASNFLKQAVALVSLLQSLLRRQLIVVFLFWCGDQSYNDRFQHDLECVSVSCSATT